MKHLICALSGVVAGILSAILGGWTLALETLGIIMVLDYATGIIVAGVFHASPKSKGGALESKAAFKGLLRKVGIIVIVIAFHQLDRLTGKSFFRDGAAWAFFAEEFISVVENLGLMGLPMPKFVVRAVEWLRNKSDALADTIPAGKPPDEGDAQRTAPQGGRQIAGPTSDQAQVRSVVKDNIVLSTEGESTGEEDGLPAEEGTVTRGMPWLITTGEEYDPETLEILLNTEPDGAGEDEDGGAGDGT